MKQVIAVHGWSGDSNTWGNWAKEFQKNGWTWQSFERGYGDTEPFLPKWKKTKIQGSNEQRVVITHSLGTHLLDNHIWLDATDVVLLCSFSRFIPKGINSRSLQTALRLMQQHIGTSDEATMLKTFLKKACEPEPVVEIPPGPIKEGLSPKGRIKLKHDLQLLVDTNGIPPDLPVKAKVLIVQGEQDSIVIPATRRSLLNDLRKHLEIAPTYWEIKNSGHLLLVQDLIIRTRNWLES